MPGCFHYSGADAVGLFVPNSGTGTHALGGPNYSGLLGMPPYSQSFALVAGVHALGAVTSNGLGLSMGNP